MGRATGVEEYHSLAVGVGGDAGRCRPVQSVVWDTTLLYYVMDEEENDGLTSAGKSLMQENILYNARNTDGIGPRWNEAAKSTRRQNSSPCVRGIDSERTVNTPTDNTGHEQLGCFPSKDPQSQWVCSVTEAERQNERVTIIIVPLVEDFRLLSAPL